MCQRMTPICVASRKPLEGCSILCFWCELLLYNRLSLFEISFCLKVSFLAYTNYGEITKRTRKLYCLVCCLVNLYRPFAVLFCLYHIPYADVNFGNICANSSCIRMLGSPQYFSHFQHRLTEQHRLR